MNKTRLRPRHIIPIFIALVINIFLLVISTYRTNYSLTLKGGLVEATDIVSINSPSKSTGTYSTIYVVSFDKSTILQNFICKFIDSVSISEIAPSSRHFSDYENYKMGEIEHNSSVFETVISAYKEASKINSSIKLNYELSSLVVTYYYEGRGYQIGDEVLMVNDRPVSLLYQNLTIDSGWLKPDIGTTLTIKRDDLTFTKTIETEEDYIYCYPYYDINYDELYPEITIRRGTTNGPSGGLLRSLSLYDELVPADLTKGRKIAGTGTISETGTVGAIGGIKQKIYTAIDNDVDIFLCPVDNYEEALEAYNSTKTDMKLYKVSTLEEAIEVLNEK